VSNVLQIEYVGALARYDFESAGLAAAGAPTYCTIDVAEQALALLLSVSRQVVVRHEQLRRACGAAAAPRRDGWPAAPWAWWGHAGPHEAGCRAHQHQPRATMHQDDLVEALRPGRIAAAALDVFEHEPLPADHPIRGLPSVVLTPHEASLSPGSKSDLRREICRAPPTSCAPDGRTRSSTRRFVTICACRPRRPRSRPGGGRWESSYIRR
jgi:hypothetical protein